MYDKLNQWKEKLSKLEIERKVALQAYKREKQEYQTLSDLTTTIEQAQKIIQDVAQATQQQAHSKIASIVTKCLAAVFDDPYEFKINFVKKRNKTEARLVFARDGVELEDPLDDSGGGVCDVASFALRAACILLSRPAKRRLFIADEPFKGLSEKYRGRVSNMLEILSNELGIQIVLVTHQKQLMIGKVIEV